MMCAILYLLFAQEVHDLACILVFKCTDEIEGETDQHKCEVMFRD